MTMITLTTEQAQQIEEVLVTWFKSLPHQVDCNDNEALATIRAARAREQTEHDLDTCPGCGGVADNGHDREFPPNPYYCTKCSEQSEQEPLEDCYKVTYEDGTSCHFGSKRLAEINTRKGDKIEVVKLRALRLVEAAPQPVKQEPVEREHITDGSSCWCNPELNYKDPETGAEVWVHKEPQ